MAFFTVKSNDGSTTLYSKSLSGTGALYTKLDENGYPLVGQGSSISAVSSWSRMFTSDLKIEGFASSANQTTTMNHGSYGPQNYTSQPNGFAMVNLAVSSDVTYYTVGEVMPETYKKLTYDTKKIQVDSAIRDGNGVRIDTNYQRKPAVYERTTYSNTSTTCMLIQFNASDYKANGYLAHFRFRIKSTLQDTYPSDNEFIINYTYRTATIIVLNSKWSTSNDIVQDIYAYFPNSDTYLDTGNYFIAFRTGRASANFIIEMIEADVPYTIPATFLPATTTGVSSQVLSPGEYPSSYPLMWTGTARGSITGSAGSATTSTFTYGTRQKYFRVGEIDTNKLMAIDHTGVAYKINTSGKKFPLPINMYVGSGSGAGTTSCNNQHTSIYGNYGITYISYLTNSSYNGFTMPTLTASDGGKMLYVRGSLDADGYFVCDGNVTLSMGAGYTYIPFGTIDPNYNGSTAQVPVKYSFNSISTTAYTLDANGKLTHIDGKQIAPKVTVSDQAPSGGSNGDIWIQY